MFRFHSDILWVVIDMVFFYWKQHNFKFDMTMFKTRSDTIWVVNDMVFYYRQHNFEFNITHAYAS